MVGIVEPVAANSSRTSRAGTPLLTVIVPCFNEQEVIEQTHRQLLTDLGGQSGFGLEIIYVDDGSRDRTAELLLGLQVSDSRVRVIQFSRNFGHQYAVSAGLDHASGNIVAVIDADLQDPPSVIVRMIDHWRAGADVIYGVRKKRKETLFKRTAYAAFYRMWRIMADIDVPLDSGDFCLMDHSVVEVLRKLPEKNRFIRGLRAWAGFHQYGLEYERGARAAGETKYSFRKLVNLASNGIFNFSTYPLRFIFSVGVITFSLALAGIFFFCLQRLVGFRIGDYGPQDVPGYTSLALIALLLGGMQILSLGIIGQYVGRLYEEAKNRPAYVVKHRLGWQQAGVTGHPHYAPQIRDHCSFRSVELAELTDL